MNTNALKKFATAARRKLIAQVAAKLNYVLGSDSPALREQADALRQLRDELTRTPKNDLIERVAYTWFNRFVALRFLDANDYQPTNVRAVSPSDGYTTPQLLDEAKNGQIDESLPVDTRRVMDLLDGRLPSRDPQNEAYQLLLIATCNALNSALPFLFEPLADYTELLMPDDMLSPQSVLGDIREGMTTEDCQQVEVIGWLYQFYISERKDAVFAAKSKVKAEDIPAATQLFTPRWVVEYMVQNTVGKLWLRNHPTSTLREKMPYYLESPSETTDAFLPITRPQDISLLDPAAGSGHILVYSFELLVHIYEEEGYSRTEIPALILEHNLMGFDIDERAAQLAAFALSMKARQYDRRFLKRGALPRVVALHKLTRTNEADWRSLLTEVGCSYLDTLVRDLTAMTQADNLGALIRPETPLDSLQTAANTMTTYARQSADLFRKPLAEDLALSLQHLALLAQKHSCVVANPPYMGMAKMNDVLGSFVKKIFPDAKGDLFSCFIDRIMDYTIEFGVSGIVTMESWMFLSTFEDFRRKLLRDYKFLSLTHFGWHVMRIAFGTVSFILKKASPNESDSTIFSYLDNKDMNLSVERPLFFPVKSNNRFSIINQLNFERIPGEVIGYWLNKKVFDTFSHQKIEAFSISDGQMVTGDNGRFLREFWEINSIQIGFGKKWLMYAKGGAYRKWAGSITNVVDWSEEARIHFRKDKISRLLPEYLWYKKGLTWTLISNDNPSFRLLPADAVFDKTGSSIFFTNDKHINYTIGLCNSIVGYTLISILNPTMAIQVRDVRNLPFVFSEDKYSLIDALVKSCISISREDWDARETSWDFPTSELLRHRTDGSLANAVQAYEAHWQGRFTQLRQNEEELNRIFIDLYGLQDELTPEVDPKDITILGQEGAPNPKGEFSFNRKEIMAQFVSYAVGCMFGRYSLDKAGLILASQGQTLADYEQFTSEDNPGTFPPDADNIIPVLDEDWFTDDIVARFRAFLRASFGERDYNQNLAFVEDSLGMDLRKWFTKYFYDDHIRRYRRRPIYWLFQSPKGSFRALIYLHRYAPDTVARLLNGYLRAYQEKLRNQRQQQLSTSLSATATPGEKTRAQKEADRLERVLAELAQYERDIIYPLATEPITMDLDDGVLVNYNRFGAALAPVKGLTGKAGGIEDE